MNDWVGKVIHWKLSKKWDGQLHNKQTDTKEPKTSHNLKGKVIHKELCKRLKFDDTTKWYMYKPESVQEKVTPKIISDFKIQKESSDPSQKSRLNDNTEKKLVI